MDWLFGLITNIDKKIDKYIHIDIEIDRYIFYIIREWFDSLADIVYMYNIRT